HVLQVEAFDVLVLFRMRDVEHDHAAESDDFGILAVDDDGGVLIDAETEVHVMRLHDDERPGEPAADETMLFDVPVRIDEAEPVVHFLAHRYAVRHGVEHVPRSAAHDPAHHGGPGRRAR